ncbi:3-deoxy-D-manno-octulosonic acid transferase [Flavobacteriales bacterium]|nr:3-deoxy-D-manno-octulosonic acid transferase [Flavobacteriales bacterium]|tara:strand:- start:49 stop:1233 length:1185 start_codon:yes stop_codon:yes gene_type:complete
MNALYNISIWFYVVAVYFASLFNSKAKLWVNGRKNIFQKIKEATKNQKNIVWFHCASLGEFEQGKPIIQAYNAKYPTHKILLTFFSPSGYEIRKNTPLADFVSYLPADTKSNAKKFISIVKPIKVVFIKYEFWFNYMGELKKQNISFYSVSSIFRDGQAFFKYKWWAEQLKNVTHFFVQDKNSAELLKSIGFKNTTISGDSRFDSVLANTQNPVRIPLIEQFSKSKPTIICGSTWPKDEIILVKYIKDHPENNYIIAPHELQNISDLKKQTNALLYSMADDKNIFTSNVLIIDSIGILSHIYSYGSIAYIGGGFGSGIHNILEAVTFGLPAIFGPNYQKFNEATELIALKGAKSISNYTELTLAIDSFANFDQKIATNYIKNSTRTTATILESL